MIINCAIWPLGHATGDPVARSTALAIAASLDHRRRRIRRHRAAVALAFAAGLMLGAVIAQVWP